MTLLEIVDEEWQAYKEEHGDSEESRNAFFDSLAPVVKEALRRELIKLDV